MTDWTDGTPESMMQVEGVQRFRKQKQRAREKGRASGVGGTRRLADITIARTIDAMVRYLTPEEDLQPAPGGAPVEDAAGRTARPGPAGASEGAVWGPEQ